MKRAKSWRRRFWQHIIGWLNKRLNHKQQRTVALPPLSRTTWRVYADIIIQAAKSLAYYGLGALGICFVLGIGMLSGYFAAIVDKTPIPTHAAMTKTLTNVESSSTMYYAHNVEIGQVQSDLIRDKVNLKDISPWVSKALIATEDEDYYQHNGVEPKAVVRAVFSALTGVGSQTGGSTLTQQVVKLQFLSSETTFKRKVTEIMYALRLNHFYSKNSILTAYLNIVTLGRNNKGQNIAGVETAARGLFGKSAKNLNLAEAAFIAGLPQSPSVYTPYTSTGALKKDLSAGIVRQHTVLFRMYRTGVIDRKQYQQAIAFNLKADFLPRATTTEESGNGYVYNLVEGQAASLLGQQLAKEDGHTHAALTKDTALQAQYTASAQKILAQRGYQIYSTIDQQIYTTMQQVLRQNKRTFGTTYTSRAIDPTTGQTRTTTSPVQNGSVLLDNNTGAVLGFIGGVSGQLNHIYTTRSPGSSIKPLLVYGPAVENKLIGSQTMLADFKTNFSGYSVTDYGNTIQNKFIPATDALAQSYNIPAVNLYNKVRGTTDPKSYMVNNGIDTLTRNDYSQLGLALGGTDYGISAVNEAAAYATFSRGGTHVSPFVIQKIVDPLGRTVYQHKTAPNRVFSSGTSYIMQQMMHAVVTKGTAAQLGYQLSFNTTNLIGKTGTSNDFKDIWFTGSTPGVTLTSWLGYDNNNNAAHTLSEAASNTNLAFWAKLANAIYRIIPDQFAAEKAQARPATVRAVRVNKATGQKAGSVTYDGRRYTVRGNTVTSLYNNWTPPATQAEFGIGGAKNDYGLFWAKQRGANNSYGKISRGR